MKRLVTLTVLGLLTTVALVSIYVQLQARAKAKVMEAVVQYLHDRQTVEDPVDSSVELLLDQKHQDSGRIVVFSYIVGPKNEAGWEGKRVVSLLKLNRRQKGWTPDGGGSLGTVALQESAPITIAWTWLGYPGESSYAYYGSITMPGISRIEVRDQQGAISQTSTSGQRAYYIERPYSGAQRPLLPVAVRAFDSQGRIVYEHELK